MYMNHGTQVVFETVELVLHLIPPTSTACGDRRALVWPKPAGLTMGEWRRRYLPRARASHHVLETSNSLSFLIPI